MKGFGPRIESWLSRIFTFCKNVKHKRVCNCGIGMIARNVKRLHKMSIAGFTNSKQAIRPAIGNQNAAEPGRQGLGKKNTTCVY